MAESRIELTRTATPDEVVLAAAGELNFNSVPALVAETTEILRTKPTRLTLDLRGVSFCDSTGLAGLVRIRSQAEALLVDLRITEPSPHVRRVMEITGLTRMFTIEGRADD